MSGWSIQRLGDVTIKIGSGATPRGGKDAYKTQGVPIIRSMNVQDLEFVHAGLAHLDDQQADLLRNSAVEAGDVLLNITGASVARCCDAPRVMQGARVNQHVAIIRPDPNALHGPYLSRYLVSAPVKNVLLSQAGGGATREALTKGGLETFEVRLPPLPTQRRIAAILSAYDDLIEVNTRRIAILEEMARRVYEEWFVRQADPDWQRVPLGDLYATSSGGTPSRKRPEYFDPKGFPWVKTKELNDCPVFDTEERVSKLGLAKSSAKLFPKHTVLLAMYGATIGRLGVLQVEAASNQACCAILPSESGLGWAYAYLTLLARRQELVDLRAGAAQQNISQQIIKRFLLDRASEDFHRKFNEKVEPVLNLSFLLHRANANLRTQRDLLLPRLVSGKLDVSEAGAALEESAA